MGRLDVAGLRYMTRDEIRVLQAVEMGMRNHQLVAGQLVTALANLRAGGSHKLVRQLVDRRLLAYERGRRYDGHRLSQHGYDYLALYSLTAAGHLDAFGSQIGTGKESDVFAVYDNRGEPLALKFHRLGRTSFRRLKLLRDYHKNRTHMSWLYLSSLSAAREYAFMCALHARGFPVPRPVQRNRHAVLMSLVDGVPLVQVAETDQPQRLYGQCMELMIRLAECGVIHCDFNEFNLMVTDEADIVLIDLPQMVSTSHPNAEQLFDRDVQCLKRFFERRFHFISDDVPVFDEIVRTEDLDAEVRASGYGKEFDDFNTDASVAAEVSDDDDSSEDGEDEKSPASTASEDHLSDVDECEELTASSRQPEDSALRISLKAETEGLTTQTEVVSSEEERVCATSLDQTSSGPQSSVAGGAEEPSEEDPEAAATRRRELKRLKQQRLDEERLEARSRLSEYIAKSASRRSGSTAASSIAPELLKKRLQGEFQRRRRRQAEQLRAKGDASAVVRSRRDNAATIRESSSGFWGYD